MSFEYSERQLRHIFDQSRNNQIDQATLELRLLAENPDCMICPTCAGHVSSMGGRGSFLRMQAFCFKCKNGTIDFEAWKIQQAEYQASRAAKTKEIYAEIERNKSNAE